MNDIFPDMNRIPGGETVIRGTGFLIFLALFIFRLTIINQYGNEALLGISPMVFYSYRLLWLLESTIFLIYSSAYIFRSKPEQQAKGFMETLFPLITAAMPFLMIRYNLIKYFIPDYGRSFQDLTFINWHGTRMCVVQADISPIPLLIIVSIMLLGTILMITALFSLWKSFSIMTEARRLVTGGIYRYIRHPLYTGEFIAYLGVLLLRFSIANLAVYLLWLFCQYTRARIEEEKLLKVFPEYEDFRKKNGMFLPKICIKKHMGKIGKYFYK